ncbi:hypothetical protein LR48_Vigan09g090900 [Vigna angularis]|uniref:Uncharacterized protein n=1 Tax=Phaseolus angularis TaxID=3914 RepID=A0A0L9VB07_PHAAN|nr:hypothetical protein LR48_Vigan09g090900 [Vigna angularis]
MRSSTDGCYYEEEHLLMDATRLKHLLMDATRLKHLLMDATRLKHLLMDAMMMKIQMRAFIDGCCYDEIKHLLMDVDEDEKDQHLLMDADEKDSHLLMDVGRFR